MWADNFKTFLLKIGWDDVHWINLLRIGVSGELFDTW
jgi:hypothetical protein